MDIHAVNELRLFIENDRDLYKQQFMPIIENIKRKLSRGIYDPGKAPKLWLYLVDNGAKKYHKLFNSGGKWHHVFPIEVRRKIADEMALDYIDVIKKDRVLNLL